MITQPLTFYSEGERIAGLWRTPEQTTVSPIRAVVHGPGWSGEMGSTLYRQFDEGLTAAGFGVLAFDYRGFGNSASGLEKRSIRGQIADLRNAVTFVGSLSGVDPDSIGLFCSGATGAAHAFPVAARDGRVRAVVSQYPIADGREWVRSGLSDRDWQALLARLTEDRTRRVCTGTGGSISRYAVRPRTADRDAVALVTDLGANFTDLPLSFVEELLEYRPIDDARNVSAPVLVIAVEGDTTTPHEAAARLAEAVMGPRSLILLKDTSHSRAYVQYGGYVMEQVTQWFNSYLRD